MVFRVSFALTLVVFLIQSIMDMALERSIMISLLYFIFFYIIAYSTKTGFLYVRQKIEKDERVIEKENAVERDELQVKEVTDALASMLKSSRLT